MIKIDRLDCPDILKTGETPATDGEMETKDAILFFSDLANHQLPYKKTGKSGKRIKESYSLYKEARKTLSNMFNGKCAYCESRITSIYNGDVEHFRPKSGYNNDLDQEVVKPGYYWLAADWKNLLFACPFCNQTNTHEIQEGGIIKEIVLGKWNQFPLASETHRLNHGHGSIYFSDTPNYTVAFNLEESERLLIDPCVDENTESFFEYNDEGAIIARHGLNPFEHKKAETSIRVYALHRLNLVQARREKFVQIKAQIRRVEIAIKNFNTYIDQSDEEKAWFEGIMREELEILKKYKDPDQEYAGLARFIIDQYLNDAGLS